MLVLVGQSGCGKTHIAKSIYRFCSRVAIDVYNRNDGWGKADHFPICHYDLWPRIATCLMNKNEEPMADLYQADCLVVDDIGAENDPFKIASDRLCQLFSRREFSFTVVTTNIGVSDWEARFDRRTSDRLLRNSVVVDMGEVPSYAVWKLIN
jgi:DNA replication protein DnaC